MHTKNGRKFLRCPQPHPTLPFGCSVMCLLPMAYHVSWFRPMVPSFVQRSLPLSSRQTVWGTSIVHCTTLRQMARWNASWGFSSKRWRHVSHPVCHANIALLASCLGIGPTLTQLLVVHPVYRYREGSCVHTWIFWGPIARTMLSPSSPTKCSIMTSMPNLSSFRLDSKWWPAITDLVHSGVLQWSSHVLALALCWLKLISLRSGSVIMINCAQTMWQQICHQIRVMMSWCESSTTSATPHQFRLAICRETNNHQIITDIQCMCNWLEYYACVVDYACWVSFSVCILAFFILWGKSVGYVCMCVWVCVWPFI